MPNYEVEVNETLARRIPVKADNETAAVDFVERCYYDSQIVLDAEDMAGVKFFVFSGLDDQDYDELEMKLR